MVRLGTWRISFLSRKLLAPPRRTGTTIPGTENIYKIYAESFRGTDHLRRILEEAQTIVSDDLAAAPVPGQEKCRASSVLHQQTASEAKDEWRNEGNPN